MLNQASALNDDLAWRVRAPVWIAAAGGLAAGTAVSALALAGGISRAALGNLAHVALIVFVLLPVLLLLLITCFALWRGGPLQPVTDAAAPGAVRQGPAEPHWPECPAQCG